MPARAVSAMLPPPNQFQVVPLSLKVLPEYCSTEPRRLPRKKAASKVFVTNGETTLFFAMDLPRVTRPQHPAALAHFSASVFPTRQDQGGSSGCHWEGCYQGVNPGALDLTHPSIHLRLSSGPGDQRKLSCSATSWSHGLNVDSLAR